MGLLLPMRRAEATDRRRMHPEYPRRVRLGAFADHGPFELCKAPGHLRVIAS